MGTLAGVGHVLSERSEAPRSKVFEWQFVSCDRGKGLHSL